MDPLTRRRIFTAWQSEREKFRLKERVLQSRAAGFTLLELVIVIVVLGVLSAYAAMKSGSTASYTLLSQAETLASDIRHAQTIATTAGKSVRLTFTAGANGTYSVGCTASTAAPCNAVLGDPMTNPATGVAFTVTLAKSVAMSVASGASPLDFNSRGQPGGAVTYRLTADTATKDVAVTAVTGFVSLP
ncbi:MAG TPA: GspH/FimT family protein [Ramlibacter sp.]|nr:GspH/FimT family protein [Ramlibacter sp.]